MKLEARNIERNNTNQKPKTRTPTWTRDTQRINGQESRPQVVTDAGNFQSDPRPSRRRPLRAMFFATKFWLSFALRSSRIWSGDVQHWLGYTAPTFPGSKFITPALGTVVSFMAVSSSFRGAWANLQTTAGHMMLRSASGFTAAVGTSLAGTLAYFDP